MMPRAAPPQAVPSTVRMGEASGRWVLLAAVLGSGMAFIDVTAVNVALPRIGRDLDAPLSALQWTVSGYTLTLAAFILLGGSLGDRYGRRRVYLVGTTWFAVASLLCALAPDPATLIAARVLQGVGGALLTPGSLAMLQSSFVPEHRARAIGAWSGLLGTAGAVGPLLGGYLVDAVSWRAVFLINLPLAGVAVLLTLRRVPADLPAQPAGRFDLAGAALCALGLAALTQALVAAGEGGAPGPTVLATGSVGLALLAGFVLVERRQSDPMMPPELFASRLFSVTNLVTFVMYGALGGLLFMLGLQLQLVAGFSALAAGAAMLPTTALMLLFSARAAALAERIGPRWPMTIGPAVAACGVLAMARIGPGADYLTDVLPAATLFGVGLTLTVAPLTATALAAAPVERAGVASGVNNAVARVAGLLAVAALPVLAGLAGSDAQDPVALNAGFGRAMVGCAGLLAVGSIIALAGIRRPPS